MNLIVQGPTLGQDQAEQLARLAGAARVQKIAERAYRLLKAVPKKSIPLWCDERRIDHAWIPGGRRFSDLRLLAMDMDSTLITMETIDELGDLVGRKAEIAAITARAMRGEIDYPESLRQRVSYLKDLPVSALAKVYEERLRLSPGAEALIGACKKHGVKMLLVSGGFTFFVERLKERLAIDYAISNTLEIKGDRLTGRVLGDIVDAEAKAAKFRQVASGLSKDQTVAIGDGANDLKMMAEAGLSIAFHAKPVVRAQAGCALNWSGLDGVLNLFE